MASLREAIATFQKQVFQKDTLYCAFWKDKAKWKHYIFSIDNDVLSDVNKNVLNGIKRTDPHAIIINGGDYIYAGKDSFVLCIEHYIYEYRDDKQKHFEQIEQFLDFYDKEEQEKQMKSLQIQEKYCVMTRSDKVMTTMEMEFEKLRDFSMQCCDLEKSCMISNAMLEIAKFLVDIKK